jgi:hypothetical protein
VADAPRAVYDHRLAVEERQHTLLRAGAHARPASDALGQVNVRVLEACFVTACFSGYGAFPVAAGVFTHLRAPHEQRQHRKTQKKDRTQDQQPS